jgi:hypothetical protein
MRRRPLASILAVLALALAGVAPATAQTTQPPPPKCANGSCQDPLFTVDYPANTDFVTAHGVETHMPVQFYDSRLFLLFGTGDLGYLQKLSAGSGWQPLRTQDGRGVTAIDVNDWADTNIGSYHELVLVFPVSPASEPPTTVDYSKNPYELVGASVDSANKVMSVKLIVDDQTAIDVGRDYYHLDKTPVPQQISTDISTSRAKFSVADEQGRQVLSGDFPIDPSPVAQAQGFSQLGSTSGMQKWLGQTAVRGGIGAFDYVFRDVADPTSILKAHAAGRPFFTPDQASFGTARPDAKLSVRPVSDFGKLVYQTGFRQKLGIVFLGGHWVLASGGWAPPTEPGTVAP